MRSRTSQCETSAAGGAERDARVAQGVGEDLPQPQSIAEECAVVPDVDLLVELETLLLRDDAEEAGVAERIREGERRRLEAQLSLLDFADVQDGADEVEEELAAAHGLVDERSLVLGETIAVGEEEPVQRGRQLVLREGG